MDYGTTEEDLKAYAKQKGVTYDPSDYQDILRNTSYTDAAGNSTGISLDQARQNAWKKIDERSSNTPGGNQPQQVQYSSPSEAWNAQPAQNTSQNQLYSLLMQRATQGTSVDRNDPNVRQQVDPLVAQSERASRNAIDDIAEKAGPLANLTGERRLAAERTGQAAGQLESEVIGREIDRRIQERQQALVLAEQYGTEQDRMKLQREIAQLQDQRAAAGQQLQASQFGASQSQAMDQFLRELALREAAQNNQFDYQWATLGV
jgi:hypothetical protein